MPEKEVKLGGLLHLPDVSSRKNLITYKRKRLINKSSKPEEERGRLINESSKPEEAFADLLHKKKHWKISKRVRDMGWAYGKMINGNRQHWQCDFCGLKRFGGGVTRLKRHLAMDVHPCPNVPAKVVELVRANFIMSEKKKNEVDFQINDSDVLDYFETEDEMIEAMLTENGDRKKEDLCKNEKLRESWRVVLENILKMPDGSSSDGVQSCIRNVLAYLDGSMQDEFGSMTKWGRALIDILSNDKFGLLCTLLYTNFGDEKGRSGCYFDFSQINICMKEGKYEQFPEQFRHDIQKVWENFQRIGHEMVDLATSLSCFSTTVIDKQIESTELENSRKNNEVNPAVPERSISVQPNTAGNSTSTDSIPALDQIELEPSENDVCVCSYCNLPIGEWEYIKCTGCNLTYHLACVNPFTDDDTLNDSWYCSVCVSAKQIQSVAEEECLVSEIDARNSPEKPVSTGPLELCKICKGPDESGEVILKCGNKACLHKYYHVKCLKKSQIPNAVQTPKQCWYCPSCLCHTCLVNKDGHLLVTCGGCDKAYHTYCMNALQNLIADSKSYCNSCIIEKEREGIKEYEIENEPENMEIYEPMKMLICALESLEGQETLVN